MKELKFLNTVLNWCIITLAVMVVIGGILFLGQAFSTYERQATVTQIWNDEIICVDNQNQEWSFFGDGYSKGEKIVLIMNDNATVGITDDIIIKVKKL